MSDPETLRNYLKLVAKGGRTVTYRDTARALKLEPPNTIHRVAEMLETLLEDDVAAGRPLIASLVVSRQRNNMPAPGFFAKLHDLGVYEGPETGDMARQYHQQQLQLAIDYWGQE
ncbi:MAG: hypothetical protein U5P41_15700 [Gammaproteobacteria bacterium]|nr:hypothetical protein [Gammaproteobacteria bacterium]